MDLDSKYETCNNIYWSRWIYKSLTFLQIYSNGVNGNSKLITQVTLAKPLPITVSKGAPILGVGTNGNQVLGNVLEDTDAGAATLQVQYQISVSQEVYVNCQVGVC